MIDTGGAGITYMHADINMAVYATSPVTDQGLYPPLG